MRCEECDGYRFFYHCGDTFDSVHQERLATCRDCGVLNLLTLSKKL
jgi:hypothetical protein